MKHLILIIMLTLAILSSCSSDDGLTVVPKGGSRDTLTLGIPSGGFVVKTCRVLTIQPEMTHQQKYRYRWSEGDSLISDSLSLCYITGSAGTHHLRLEVLNSDTVYLWRDVDVVSSLPAKAYSPYVSSVPEYLPAPGQFVNELPEYSAGDTQADMNRKVLEAIGGDNGQLITLGAFGGYVVCGFDHTIINVPGMCDFRILGNAFYASSNPHQSGRLGGSSEPGVVEVAYDRNGNGQPDEDEWYELAGSAYADSLTCHDYAITYSRASAGHVSTPDADHFLSDSTYIPWKDNRGGKGFLRKLTFHDQDYYPAWLKEDSHTYRGTCLPPNAVDESHAGTYWVLYAYAWGYADNCPNKDDGSCFDISWAVDLTGHSVHLPGVDFIRIHTGVNQQCGWIGETSTEVSGIHDLHLLNEKIHFNN